MRFPQPTALRRGHGITRSAGTRPRDTRNSLLAFPSNSRAQGRREVRGGGGSGTGAPRSRWRTARRETASQPLSAPAFFPRLRPLTPSSRWSDDSRAPGRPSGLRTPQDPWQRFIDGPPDLAQPLPSSPQKQLAASPQQHASETGAAIGMPPNASAPIKPTAKRRRYGAVRFSISAIRRGILAEGGQAARLRAGGTLHGAIPRSVLGHAAGLRSGRGNPVAVTHRHEESSVVIYTQPEGKHQTTPRFPARLP